MPTLSKNRIRFDANDFLSGLYPQYKTSIGASPNYTSNQLILSTSFNPYRAFGYAAPGFNPTDLTTASVMTGVGLNVALAAESNTNYAYIVCDNDRINRLNISTKTFSNAGSWPHAISGAGVETGNDIISYDENIGGTRTSSIFYSWNDSGGAWNVGLFNTSSGAFDDDWLTTIPASAPTLSGNNKPHPMVRGADDLLYIADGNVLHALDGATGTNGTFSSAVLTLPAGFIIKSFAKLPNYLVIFAYYSAAGNSVNPATESPGPATAFFYDYLSLDPTYVYPIAGGAVTAGFSYNGTVGCFVQDTKPVQDGENRHGQLRIWDGASFSLVEQFIGNAPVHGGVDIVGNSIQWNTDGILHCYGSPYVEGPDGLNKLATGGGSSLGLLRTIGGLTGFQMMSSGTTTLGGAQYIKVNSYASAALLQTSAVTPLFSPGCMGRIKNVTVTYGAEASAGREITVTLIKENATVSTVVSGQSAVTTATMSAFYEWNTSGSPFGTFRDLSLALQWGAGSGESSAPVVRTVDVEFDEVTIGSNI